MRGVCVGRTFGFTKRCQVYEPLKNSLGCNALKSGHYSLKQLFNYPSIIPQQQPAQQKNCTTPTVQKALGALTSNLNIFVFSFLLSWVMP